ncbi:hypothetical protein JQK88_07315 [Mesorhizobium caraganae]|uniref:hypothetical protein n=1 Tax=Mesorhizobium caraganae TaxID=483206 RepID=UPI00193A9B87|nr:hypothetical protein [Mesorhizobium caraganae]MBM2711059.1 hypothetical protein [Mesorhizobium caraganae]
MRKSKKSAVFAVGLFAGVALAFLFLVWAFPGFRNPTYQQERYQHEKNDENGKDNPVVRPSIWETYTSPTDTYAQWIAAISAIASFGVSIWAVRLVRDTLELNRAATEAAINASNASMEANRDAKELFAAEQRPWLSLRRPEISAAISDGSVQVYFKAKAENIGDSPAFQAELKTQMLLSRLPMESVVGVRKYAEECSLQPDWENDHKLIFHGKDRELWAYSEEIIDPEKPFNFIRIFYCVIYRANGIERTLATAGEVIFSGNIPADSSTESLVAIERYVFYGMSYAS